jgi:putative flavoprotein involved in K+ transport
LESITMIQRSPTMVVSTDSVLDYGLGPLYREEAELSHEEADLVVTTVPYQLALQQRWKQVTTRMMEHDAELLQGLRRAGLRLDTGPDGTGIFAKSASQGGGFYINMGCAKLLIEGHVSVRYATVERLESDAVIARSIVDNDDNVGTRPAEERLPADLIVYATGFDTMDQWVSEICGPDVAQAVGRTWGLGLGHNDKDPGPWEGELRNMWKPTTVDGLWFQGGNLAQNRHYSRYLALQLAARYDGLETNVYGTPTPTRPADTAG